MAGRRMGWRLIPPVAVPVAVGRIAALALDPRSIRDGREFAGALAVRLGRPSVQLFGSGRAALAAWLRAVAAPGRDEVVVPAYTCFSVPASAVRAGLRVRLVDVDPATLGTDPRAVAEAVGPRTAAVVTAHLLDASADAEAIALAAKQRDPAVRVIEDAAQAWPPASRGSGAIDAVLLSFGRGKPLPLGGGGALASADPRVERAPAPRRGGLGAAAALAGAAALARPRWYRLPDSIPGLGIGVTTYDPEFDAAPLRRWQAALGVRLLDELPRFVAARGRNATRLAARVETLAGLRLPRPARGIGPLRLPVLAPSRRVRDELLPALRRLGVGASALYPGTLADVPRLRPRLVASGGGFPGARELADRLFTLPVYPGLSERDLDAVAGALERALAEVAR
jgi:dTDP-4-amino-4,6-dideoxygalactose transaminase